MPIDPGQSVNQILGWPGMPEGFDYDGGLPGRYELACMTPLNLLGPTELIMLVTQDFGTEEAVVPCLLQEIRKDPGVEKGEYISIVVHNIRQTFWRDNPELQKAAVALFNEVDKKIPEQEVLSLIFFIEKNTGDGKVTRGLVGEWLGDE